jgi:primosomal protein N' (replication factor Y)
MKDMFSWFLKEKMQETLEAGQQIILFQNRRGFSSFVECTACGYVPKCKHCDVSLTYHKNTDKLVCHYCGYTQPMPPVCPSCGAESLKDKGFGTEKVVEALQKHFPDVPVDRLDVDITRSKTQYQGVLSRFASGETKILVGTQMVAKGFDFDNIGLVGILNADNMMNFPDFRASERAFQLMVQVSGRAGRRNQQGLVVLQTAQPDHYLIPAILTQNTAVFYQNELQERKEFGYPPFVRLIEIQVKHKEYAQACQIADDLAHLLSKQKEVRVLGPSAGVIGRVQQYFVRQMLLKISGAGAGVRQQIIEQINQIKKIHPTAVVVVDVDPI